MIGDGATIGHGGRRLVLSRGQSGPSDRDAERESLWSLKAELHADGLTAATSFWLGPEGVEERLDVFFERLAADWRGWAGVRAWEKQGWPRPHVHARREGDGCRP